MAGPLFCIEMKLQWKRTKYLSNCKFWKFLRNVKEYARPDNIENEDMTTVKKIDNFKGMQFAIITAYIVIIRSQYTFFGTKQKDVRI